MNNKLNNNKLNNLKNEILNWEIVQVEIKNKLGKDIYESWLKKIIFVEEFNNYILLSVPTRFIRDWIVSRYLDQILQVIRSFKRDIIRIEFKIEEQNLSKNSSLNKLNIFEELENKENVSFIKDSYLQYNRIDPNKRLDNFITGSGNKLAGLRKSLCGKACSAPFGRFLLQGQCLLQQN